MKKFFILSAILCSALSAKADWSQYPAYNCTSDQVANFDVNCELDYMHRWARIIKDNMGADYYAYNPVLVIPEKIKFNGVEFTVVEYTDDVWSETQVTSVTFPSTLRRAGKLNTTVTELKVPSIETWSSCDNYTEIYSSVVPTFLDGTDPAHPVVPEGVRRLGYASFSYTALKRIDLPSTLTEIGDKAFYFSGLLANPAIPESVVSIGNEAFAYCRNLTGIQLPKGLEELGEGALYSTGLKMSFEWPNGVTEVAQDVLANTYIDYMNLPSGVEYVRTGAFSSDEYLEVVVLGSGVVEVEKGAFYNTPLLTKIGCLAEEVPTFDPDDIWGYGNNTVSDKTLYVEEDLIDAYKNSTWNAFKDIRPLSELYTIESGGVIYALDYKTQTAKVVYSPNASGDIHIPAFVDFFTDSYTVTAIDDDAFDSLPIGSVTLPNTLVTIGANAFADTDIRAVEIPSSVTTIGDEAFSNKELKDVLLGSGVQTIGSKAFNSRNLTLVTCWAEKVPTAAADAFGKTIPTSAVLRVPAGFEDVYGAVEPWSKFNSRSVDTTVPCSKPTVRYADGKVLVECATPGASCRYDVIGSGATVDNQIPEIKIRVYAEAEDRTASEVVEVNLIDLLPMDGDLNHNGEVNIGDVTTLVSKILCK